MEASLNDPGRLGDIQRLPAQAMAFELCQLAQSLLVADDPSAIAALELAARVGGASGALFVWLIPGDDGYSTQSISALDPDWSASTLRRLHGGACDWLAHAARSNEPLLIRRNSAEVDAEVDDGGASLDLLRTVWLIPAPSPRGSDVLGLLIFAGRNEQQLGPTGRLMPAYRALALGLTDWFRRRGRDDLVRRAHLTDRDIELLRHESLGHGSKRIASALLIEPKTIDCRFHRLNVRLGVANRRDAVRLCQRYGLI